MVVRPSAHAADEKAIFGAFLAACPSFAAQVAVIDQPDAPFPDVVVTTTTGEMIDFELGGWLDGPQLATAKRYDSLACAIRNAIGPQGKNPSRHFRMAMLTPCEEIPRFDSADLTRFRTELWGLVAVTEYFWPTERSWSSHGRPCWEFTEHPILGKYLRSAQFHPLVVRGVARPWAKSQPWIVVKSGATSYSSDSSLRALVTVLEQKIRHYGHLSRPTRLIIHYDKAFAYNTPFVGVQTEDFADVALFASQAVAGQATFEKIYLLNALQPGLEAFEIYPDSVRCP